MLLDAVARLRRGRFRAVGTFLSGRGLGLLR
jgi:hypothetical protein